MRLVELHERHIKGTEKGAIVPHRTILLCNLTRATQKALSVKTYKVYINTRVLKHLYDTRPAEEYERVIRKMAAIVKYPEKVYQNRDSKRGDLVFTKTIGKEEYLCSLEISEEIQVATSFRIRKKTYLDNYKLLWSWRDGKPSS